MSRFGSKRDAAIRVKDSEVRAQTARANTNRTAWPGGVSPSRCRFPTPSRWPFATAVGGFRATLSFTADRGLVLHLKGVSASDEVPVNLRAAGVSIEVTVGANGSVSRCTQIAAIALQRHRPEGPCDVECGRVAEPIDTDRVAATRAVSMSTKPALVVIQRSRAPCRPVR